MFCIRLLSIQSTIRPHHRLRVPHRRVLQIRDTSTVFAALSLAHRTGGGDLHRLARGRGRFLECCEEGLHRLGGEVLVVVVVDLDHGGIDTGTQTLNFDKGEEAVFRRVAGGDTQVLRDGVDDLGATAATELAWCLPVPLTTSQELPPEEYEEFHTVVQS